MIKYVLVFLFSKSLQNVLLIEKQRGPAHLIGKWTGLGGKVEPGELPLNAAIREVKEESGIDASHILTNNDHFCTLFKDQEFEMFIYAASTNNIFGAKQQETEVLSHFLTKELNNEVFKSNLTKNSWLINMALCKLRGCNDFLMVQEN